MKIKKGDEVMVISGASRGKKGKVLEAFPNDNKVIVEGVRVRTVKRKNVQTNEVEEKELLGRIDVSNVSVIDPKDGKPTRVKIEEKAGKKIRVAARSGKEL